jgi:DNA-binding NarL/FixJ family response regulator
LPLSALNLYQLSADEIYEVNGMTQSFMEKTILVCDTQPVAARGIQTLLEASGDLRFAGAVCSLDNALDLILSMPPAVVLLDKGFGTAAVMDWLRKLGNAGMTTSPAVWGTGMTEAEALRFLQAGARGIMRRTTEPEMMVTCLRSVSEGNTWMEEGIFGSTERLLQPRRSQLTPREQQIAELVERGLRNRDIGRQLGIQTGTVKIHLKHIFEKTGVRGRYGLALTGLREKGNFAPAPAPVNESRGVYLGAAISPVVAPTAVI